MDQEPEELQFLGIIGVSTEAYKLLLAWRRIFTQIVLSFVLPLAFISVAHIHISYFLFSKINTNETALDITPDGSPAESRLLSRLASEWIAVLLFKAVYLIAVLVLSLLSTSAVVYTVASVYTAKDLTFVKVLSVVPKVWKRLMVTFLYAFLLLATYNIATFLLILASILLRGDGGATIAVVVLILIAYFAGLVYVSVVWHVASVISVLEDLCGIGAMKKSRALVRGKMGVAAAVFLVLNFAFFGIEAGYRNLVVRGVAGGWAARVVAAAVLVSLLAVLMLLGLVVQTVIYFICKSYHHESIDKSSLSDHLEVYLGEYAPLREETGTEGGQGRLHETAAGRRSHEAATGRWPQEAAIGKRPREAATGRRPLETTTRRRPLGGGHISDHKEAATERRPMEAATSRRSQRGDHSEAANRGDHSQAATERLS